MLRKKAWHLVDLPPHLTDANVSDHRHGFLDLVQILSDAARAIPPHSCPCVGTGTSESRC